MEEKDNIVHLFGEIKKPSLEYMTLYHQLLTASVRVSRIDPDSPAADTLLQDFLRKFPDYRRNPYLKTMSPRHRLLLSQIQVQLVTLYGRFGSAPEKGRLVLLSELILAASQHPEVAPEDLIAFIRGGAGPCTP